MTLSIRKELYASILRKDIGWFDLQENSPSILTSVMAEDTTVINGVASDLVHTQVEAGFAMVAGVFIAYTYCWQLSLVTTLCMPAIGLGVFLAAKFRSNILKESGNLSQEANLLAGDAMTNYRTVASFANDEAIVAKYEEILRENIRQSVSTNIKAGLAFGFSQFSIMCVFSALFYSAGKLLEQNGDINPEDIFISIFAMMFGAVQAGNAQ